MSDAVDLNAIGKAQQQTWSEGDFAMVAGLVTMPSEQLAEALSGWLEAPPDLRAATRAGIVAATRETYSWDGVARSVIAAAQGDLDGLPNP